ncbi:MAG: hypothetical protein ABFD79_12475 [Phycisphaerales bacterium]
MIPQILAMKIQGDYDGGTIDIGSWPFIIGSLPFIVVIVFIIAFFWFFLNKKRLEHQQIMAAIEKGTPLSELTPKQPKGANWIINLSAGIGLIIMGLGSITVVLTATRCTLNQHVPIGIVFFGLILLTVGITRLIRGILQHKAEKLLAKETLTLNTNERS